MHKTLIITLIVIFTLGSSCGYNIGKGDDNKNNNNQTNNELVQDQLFVSLDADSPDAYTAPANGKNLNFGSFKFEATSHEDIAIHEITLTREGLGLASDFEAVKLMVNDVMITSSQTFNADNKVTFQLDNYIHVDRGASVTVTVLADMKAQENSMNKICINSPEDVVAIGTIYALQQEAHGLPVCGNEVTSGQNREIIFFKEDFGSGNLIIEDTSVFIVKVQFFNDTSNDMFIEQLAFNVSLAPMDYRNPTLIQNGTTVGIAGGLSHDGNNVIFDTSQNPVTIPGNGSVTLELHMGIVWGICQDVGARLNHTNSIIVDQNSQEAILVYHADTEEYAERQVIGAGIQYASLDSPSTTTVEQEAQDHVFLEIGFHAGVDASINEFTVNVITDAGAENFFSDVRAWIQNQNGDWTVVASPQNPSAENCSNGMCTYTFHDEFFVNQCEYTVLRFTADVDQNTPVETDVYFQYPLQSTKAADTNNNPIDLFMGNTTYDGNVQEVIAP